MFYLSNMLGRPVYDSTGEKLGTVSDLAISTGEVFPRITSLAFKGPGRTPFMISWRKYVEDFTEDEVRALTPSLTTFASATFSPLRFFLLAICSTSRSLIRRA